MKKIIYIFIFLIIVSCSNTKTVYWCGDHPCINKKEREAYFKKTMIVEIKDSKNTKHKSKSDIENILQQAQIDEKKRIKEEKALAKQVKIEEKKRIKEEKALAKQVKIEEKKRIKEEKALARSIELEEKKQKNAKKKIAKKNKKKPIKNMELDVGIGKTKIDLNKFSEVVEKITKQNYLKPFPDINDIPK